MPWARFVHADVFSVPVHYDSRLFFVPVSTAYSTAYPTGQSDLFLLILGTSFVADFPNLEHAPVPVY